MGSLARSADWSSTPIGPAERWPQSLRTAVNICLSSRFPQLIWWGPELIQIYNDGYRPVLGAKHPEAMGQRGDECWSEVWDVLGPLYRQVKETGQATWSEDLLLVMQRHGFTEETYFTFSYSAIRDESGGVEGVLVTCVETTEQVLSERRLDTLRTLGTRAGEARTPEGACVAAATVLEDAHRDVPFALLYLLDREGAKATVGGAVGLEIGSGAAPAEVDLEDGGGPWPLAEVVDSGSARILTGLRERLGPLPSGPWDHSPDQAMVLPVARPGRETPAGILVAGVSPALELDEGYESFLHLVASSVATAVANAEAHEEERRRAEALAELDRAKTSFFSNVSHEFRTPLTLMLSPLEEALGSGEELEPESLEMVYRNALRLLRLVNTLLDFSRIEAGRLRATFQPTDATTLTRDLASTFRSTVEMAGLELELGLEPFDEPVWLDREMWEKVVLNLLSNAVKHTFEGSIEVSLDRVGSWAVLRVRDTGVGIPAAELPHVFDRFHRVRESRSRTHEGSGIGLALVEELVELHGGSIAVESEEGRGTTFTVRIPLGRDHLPDDEVVEDGSMAEPAADGWRRGELYVQEAGRWIPDPGGTGSDLRQTGEQIAEGSAGRSLVTDVLPDASGGRILLADDNADLREYVGGLLGRHWQVEAVADGRAALEAAGRQPPDLVLADVMMPGLNGFELLEALRSSPELREIPVVLLSARAGQESRVEGLEAGADDYLVKPFSARELLARVGATMALARLRRSAAEERGRLIRELAAERQRLAELFEQAPAMMAVLHGPDHVFEMVNPRYRSFLGEPDLVGRSARELFPEPQNRKYLDLLDRVYRTGETYVGEEEELLLKRRSDAPPETTYLNFVYHPLRRADESVTGIFIHGVDVTELVQARKQAEEASRAKSDFMATVSHELRTPLSAIIGYVDLMLMGIPVDLPGGASDHVERVAASARHLKQLIDELLTFARIRGGREEFVLDSVDGDALTEELRAVVEPLAGQKGLEFRIEGDTLPDDFRTDPAKLRQILLNLLGNAVKFTERGEVVLRVEVTAGAVRFSVRDTGIGIAEEHLPSLFEPFWQGDQSRTRSKEGTGLGLALSDRLAELLGGSISVEAEEGIGSEFTLTLPRDGGGRV